MATLKLYPYFEITQLTGEVKKGGDRNTARELTVDGLVYDVTVTLAAEEQEVIWEAGDGGLDSFDFLWVDTTGDAADEVAIAMENSNGTANTTILKSNGKHPLVICQDDIFISDSAATNADIAANQAFADTIDEVTVENLSTTNTVSVRLVLVT